MGGSQSTPTTSPSSSTSRPEVYSVLTPTAAILDFNPNAGTPEYAALSNLLSDNLYHNVTVLNGLGGVGKTTILQALAAQPRIHARFHNAVWMFQLGQQAKLAQLKHEFIAFVSQVCDSQFANRFQDNILDDKLDKRAVADLVRHLADRHILLIFDDVWRMSGSVLELFQRVVTEVQSLETCSFKLLVSTRSEHIANEGCPIHVQLRSPHGPMSERMLLWYAGFEADMQSKMCPSDRRAFNSILQKCSGLPLALAVAGRGVKRLHNRPTTSQSRVSAWVWYAGQLDEHVEMLGEECPHHPGLRSSLRLNLQGMGENWNVSSITPEEVFRSLSVLQKQMVISVHCLQRLWAISPKDVKRVVDIFHDSSLISIDQGEASEDGKRDGIRIHDLMNDISAHMADESDGKTRWHERLLDGYAHDLSCTDPDPNPDPDPGSFKTAQTRPWWRLKETEKYMQNNVLRHLLGAERTREAFHLLMDYRWMQKINEDEKCIAFLPIIADVRLLMKKIEKVGDTDAQGTINDLRIIVETMEKCMLPYCKKNRRESTFQLYGRLVSLCSESAVVKHVLWSIEKYAKKPWVRANMGVLESATSSYFKRTLSLDFSAVCMEIGTRDDEVLVGSDTGMLYVLNSRDGSKVRRLPGHETSIVSIVVERESNDVLSCSSDGTVIVWRDRRKLNTVKIDELEEEETIVSMQLRSQCVVDGIILGSSLGRLILLDVSSRSVDQVIESENEWVDSSVARRGDDVAVSASRDGKLWLWDKVTLQVSDSEFEGHKDSVHAVAICTDKRLIASISKDRSVRIWNFPGQSDLGSFMDFKIEFVGDVKSLQFLGVTQTVYLVSAICIFQYANTVFHNALSGAYRYNLEDIKSMRLSEDGSKFLIASTDKVHVLDVMRNLETLETKEGSIYADRFSMSSDNASMVSYERDSRVVELWGTVDISNGVDGCVAKFSVPRESERIGLLAVSNNRQFVAFCKFHECIIYVVDMQKSKLLHTFDDLENWWISVRNDEVRECPIEHIRFESNNILTATARYKGASGDEVVSKSWDVSTGTLEEHVPASDGHTEGDHGDDSTLRLDCEKIGTGEFSRHLKITDGPEAVTLGTLEESPLNAIYTPKMCRLWFLNRYRRLTFVDLITNESDLEERIQPKLPELSGIWTGLDSRIVSSRGPKFTVFLSHAGPDKVPLALRIYKQLRSQGISVFFDLEELIPGDEADEEMNYAMETALIFVIILSPEYPARKWTMKEAQCALRRLDEAKKGGLKTPILIPVFYRLNIEQCKDANLLCMKNENGDLISQIDGLFERLKKGEITAEEISECMKRFTRIAGIENPTGVTNKDSDEDLKAFAGTIVAAVMRRVAEIQ